MKRKVTERNTIQQVKQMRTIAHHQRSDAQPVPEQYFPPNDLLPGCIAEHDALWSGIFLWSATVSCFGCVLS